jgi:hypothetical protein
VVGPLDGVSARRKNCTITEENTEKQKRHYTYTPSGTRNINAIVLAFESSTRLKYIAHLRLECHHSKCGIFELLVLKETFADALLTGVMS